jgi:hypothetical protein
LHQEVTDSAYVTACLLVWLNYALAVQQTNRIGRHLLIPYHVVEETMSTACLAMVGGETNVPFLDVVQHYQGTWVPRNLGYGEGSMWSLTTCRL